MAAASEDVDASADERRKKLTCVYCGKYFNYTSNLYKHVRRIHKTAEPLQHKKTISCSEKECAEQFRNLSAYRDHLSLQHGFSNEMEKMSFKSFEDFSAWLLEEEKRTSSHYVLKRSSTVKKTNKHGNVKCYSYYCHRSGKYIPKGKGLRSLKTQGSSKIGFYCTSTMEVAEYESKVLSVTYHKSHYGHEHLLGHLHLPDIKRKAIAEKLSQGMTFENLLEESRNDRLTRKDLHNIQSSFKLQLGRGTNGELDTWESWLEKAYSLGDECPVLYYKNRGVAGEGGWAEDDFLVVLCNPVQRQILAQFGHNIVCIDVTDVGTSADFVLTSVVVVDEYDEPFPAAFCLSNRVDVGAYLCFFEALHGRVGKVSPSVFVSDGCSAVLSAWGDVMGEYETYYVSPWWMEQTWKAMLAKIPPGRKRKRTTAHRRLQALLVETDKERFHQELSAFLDEMQGATETRNFASQFLDEFAIKPHIWAHCFLGPVLSGTMCSLETMHTALKRAFSNGKTFGHLIRCIYALDKFVRYRNDLRLDKTNDYSQDDRNVLENDSDVFVEVLEEDNLWDVQLGLQESHLVSRTSDSCLLANCFGTECIHCYACSCTDYLGDENSCRHVQAVAQLCLALPGTSRSSDRALNRSVEEKVHTILSFLKKGKLKDHLLRKMHKQMNVWIDEVETDYLPQSHKDDQPEIQQQNTSKDLFLLIYPQKVSSMSNKKVPVNRHKRLVSVCRKNAKQKPIRNVPLGFDHTY